MELIHKKYALSGAGVVVYLSGLVKGENTINIKYVGGEATVIIKMKMKL